MRSLQARLGYAFLAFGLTALAVLLISTPAHAAGQLDPSFGGDGKVTTSFGGPNDGATSVAIDSHGRIVVAGYHAGDNFSSNVIVRYKPDGTLDHSFSGDGKVTTKLGTVVTAIVDSHDRVVVAGEIGGPHANFGVARYKADGTPDGSFSGDGMASVDIGGYDYATSVAIDPQGRIVLGGVQGQYNYWLALARFNANGTLDRSFSGDGKTVSDFVRGRWSTAIALDAQGRTVAAGYTQDGTNSNFAVVRYTASGAFDQSFGKVRTDFAGGSDQANSVDIGPTGEIVLGGDSYNGVRRDFALARYRPDGTLDKSFGKVKTNFGGTNEGAEIGGIAFDSRGRLVAAGHCDYKFFALARYNPDGSLDPSFGTGGKVKTHFGGVEGATSVAIDSGDRIVAAGDNAHEVALARYVGYP